MQIVIDISKKVYNALIHTEFDASLVVNEMRKSIVHGTPLPKGHGRLIDADEAISKICGRTCGCHLEECENDRPCYSVKRIKSAPTIIEADKENE